ncbi:FKBP-type peptidyl-prolyl cis-trans isomerase [Gammaproteobacteria bacterium AS21]
MKKTLLTIAMTAVLSAPGAFAATLDSDEKKLSYSFGLMVAQQMKPNFDTLDIEAFSAAVKDVFAGAEPQLKDEEVEAVLQKFQSAAVEKAQAKAKEAAQANIDAGTKFLAENGKRDGVVTTQSGLQIEIIEAGSGANPSADDTVVVHYAGKTLEGVEFDSSIKRNQPATFPLNGVIAGWTEGLQLLKEGGKAKFYIPSELAYGASGAGEIIEPGATLIFDVELIEIKKEALEDAAAQAPVEDKAAAKE